MRMLARRLPTILVPAVLVAFVLACVPKEPAVVPIPARKLPIPGPFDAAAPMVNSGTIIAEGNTHLGKVTPAKEEMKNVPAMGDVPVERFMAAMLALKGAIGADCANCHPGEDYSTDQMRAKLKTRQMIRMSMQINTLFFDRQARVTCFTCHRGKWTPEQEALEARIRPATHPVKPITDDEGMEPSETIYANVVAFKSRPASSMMATMSMWTAELGADCTYCHTDDGNWAAEGNVNKDVARAMMGMMDRINKDWFGGERIVTCWGCHRGKPIPERVAPEADPGEAPETVVN